VPPIRPGPGHSRILARPAPTLGCSAPRPRDLGLLVPALPAEAVL